MFAVEGDLVATSQLDRLLRDAAPTTRVALASVARSRGFSTGEVITRQGDPADLVMLSDGVVAVRRSNPDGRRLTLYLMTAGEVAGLPSVAGHPHSAVDLIGLTAGRIAVLPGALVRRYAAQDAALGVRLVDLAVEHADRLVQRIDEATFEHARSRLATIILEYEPLIAGGRSVVSRGDLAGLIGTSREMLGCALRALESDGIVSRAGRRIEIRDHQALEREGERGPSGDETADAARRARSTPPPISGPLGSIRPSRSDPGPVGLPDGASGRHAAGR